MALVMEHLWRHSFYDVKMCNLTMIKMIILDFQRKQFMAVF